jgi:hypothetical protein
MDNYRPVCADLTSTEQAEVGRFVVDLLSAQTMGNHAKIASLISEALTDLSQDEDSLDLFLRTAEYIECCGENMDKLAMAGLMTRVSDAVTGAEKVAAMSTPQKWQLGLGVAGAGLAAAPFVAHAVKARQRDQKIKASFAQALQDHPHLKGDPHLHRYFQAVVDFAPTVAANSLLAGNVLNSMHQIGPQAVTPRFIGELLSVEKDYSAQTKAPELLGDAAKGATGLSGTIGEIVKANKSSKSWD